MKKSGEKTNYKEIFKGFMKKKNKVGVCAQFYTFQLDPITSKTKLIIQYYTYSNFKDFLFNK